jgi:hypothetical protein
MLHWWQKQQIMIACLIATAFVTLFSLALVGLAQAYEEKVPLYTSMGDVFLSGAVAFSMIFAAIQFTTGSDDPGAITTLAIVLTCIWSHHTLKQCHPKRIFPLRAPAKLLIAGLVVVLSFLANAQLRAACDNTKSPGRRILAGSLGALAGLLSWQIIRKSTQTQSHSAKPNH